MENGSLPLELSGFGTLEFGGFGSRSQDRICPYV